MSVAAKGRVEGATTSFSTSDVLVENGCTYSDDRIRDRMGPGPHRDSIRDVNSTVRGSMAVQDLDENKNQIAHIGMDKDKEKEEMVDRERERDRGSEAVHSIRETACRFLQLLETLDQNLFVQCVQHSPLVTFIVNNIATHSHRGTNICVLTDLSGVHRPTHGIYDKSKGSRSFIKSKYLGEVMKGGESSFSAQSDLLCVVMRADLRSRKQKQINSTSPSPFSSSPIHSYLHSHTTTATTTHATNSTAYSTTTATATASLTDNLFKQIPHAPLAVLSSVTIGLQSVATQLSKMLPYRGDNQKVLSNFVWAILDDFDYYLCCLYLFFLFILNLNSNK